METFILETFGVKQGANTSFKKFLTEPRGNFSFYDFFLADTRGKFLVIKVSCVRQGEIS